MDMTSSGREKQMADTTASTRSEADRVAAFIRQVEALDAVDLANVARGGIQTKVVDWGFVSHVESFPVDGTVACHGNTLTMQSNVEVHMRDGGVIRLDVVVVGDDEDDLLGLKDIRPVGTMVA